MIYSIFNTKINVLNGMKAAKPSGLPDDLCQTIKTRRKALGWSQDDLARHAGLAQRHISGIETGKIIPRYDTLVEILRVLDRDLLVVPRELVPVVQALVRDAGADANARAPAHADERPLYAIDEGAQDG